MGGELSVGAFLWDPSPYLGEVRRKPQKTLSGWVDKQERGLNLAPPVYQFWAQNCSATGGAGLLCITWHEHTFQTEKKSHTVVRKFYTVAKT